MAKIKLFAGPKAPKKEVNKAPAAVTLSKHVVSEGQDGAVVGVLKARDPNKGDIITFTVSDDRFEIGEVNGQQVLRLKEGVSLDYETAKHLTVQVTATDQGGLSKTQNLKIVVKDVNEAPTAISLSATTAAENTAGGVIGKLTAIDPDKGDKASFSVKDTAGPFEAVKKDGAWILKLKAGASLDFETGAEVKVDVIATDKKGLNYTQTFTVTVTDQNEGPTAISLEGNRVDEDTKGAEIGTLTATDPEGQALTLQVFQADATGNLVLDANGEPIVDTRFVVADGKLKLAADASLDADVATSVVVRATDTGGLSTDQAFVIEVAPVNVLRAGSDESAPSALVGTVGEKDIFVFDSAASYATVSGFEAGVDQIVLVNVPADGLGDPATWIATEQNLDGGTTADDSSFLAEVDGATVDFDVLGYQLTSTDYRLYVGTDPFAI